MREDYSGLNPDIYIILEKPPKGEMAKNLILDYSRAYALTS